MKLSLLLLFICLSFTSMAQQTKNDTIHYQIIKTNLVLIAFYDINFTYDIVRNKNVFEFGLGYRIKPNPGEIPFKNEAAFFDVTSWTRFGGPHIGIGYKRYMNNYLQRNKSFFTINTFYKYNDYQQIIEYRGTLGTNSTYCKLAEDDAHLIGARFLMGKEINIKEHFVLEIFGGIGYVYKFITRNTINEGTVSDYSYGRTGPIEVNEISQREANNFTVQFGVTFGYIIK